METLAYIRTTRVHERTNQLLIVWILIVPMQTIQEMKNGIYAEL